MIKVENISWHGFEEAIRGMRQPMNSHDRLDTEWRPYFEDNDIELDYDSDGYYLVLGENDKKLMKQLCKGGPVHRKFMRMITVYMDITAPLYLLKEFDTYKVGTVANSSSTMHKIHAKEFTLDDFSCEKLSSLSRATLLDTVGILNIYRDLYNNWDSMSDELKIELLGEENCSRKDAWMQMIQLLPSSYNQKRTIMMNYEVLANIYEYRKDHKLDEWREFCKIITEKLPYPQLITGEFEEDENGTSENC